jgi:hypothetical protein
MLLIPEIASLVFGIITLATGTFNLIGIKVCYGTSARVIGVLLILAPPIDLALYFVIFQMLSARGALDKGPEPLIPWLPVMEAPLLVVSVAALVIVWIYGSPPRNWAWRPGRYDYERPRWQGGPAAHATNENITQARPVQRPPDDRIRE